MSRPILVYGQSGAGKSYSLKSLDPKTTFIVDADQKGALPWRGHKQFYTKSNFYSTDNLDKIHDAICAMNTEKFAHIRTLVIDGISKALSVFPLTYEKSVRPKNPYEKWNALYEKSVAIFKAMKEQRENLNVVMIGNVELGDPYQPNSVDKLKVPGQAFKAYEPESDFNYVFYAKSVDGVHVFETWANHSTAKTPEGCFAQEIDNDLADAISLIDEYEGGVENVESPS